MDTTEERRIAPISRNEIDGFKREIAAKSRSTYSPYTVERLLARLDRAEAVVEAAEALTTEFFVTRNERQWEPDAAAAFDRLESAIRAWHTGGTE